jgi:NADP-dependent 3-hydroxy acid dehydrogenase YdfG
MSELSVKVAWITGASRGLGKAMALALSDAGATIALVARDAAKLHEIREEIVGRGGAANVFLTDITRETSACFLCSESAGFATGTDILIDGGWCARQRVAERVGFEPSFA